MQEKGQPPSTNPNRQLVAMQRVKSYLKRRFPHRY
jgi:hypothetical protein